VYLASQDRVWYIEKNGSLPVTHSISVQFLVKGQMVQFFWQRSKHTYGAIVYCINSSVVSLKDDVLVKCKTFMLSCIFLPLFFSVNFYLFSEA